MEFLARGLCERMEELDPTPGAEAVWWDKSDYHDREFFRLCTTFFIGAISDWLERPTTTL